MTYGDLRRALAGELLPAMLVDLDAFDRNVDRVAALVAPSKLPVRVATKSLRVPALVGRALDRGRGALRGLMCYAVGEAALYAREGLDDLFVAYPIAQAADVDEAARLSAEGVSLKIAFDAEEHLERLSAAATARGATVDVVLCVDMSVRLLGDRVHLGVRRSPVASPARAVELARRAARLRGVRLRGIMGYEAQVAGLADDRPRDLERWGKRALRRASIGVVRDRRAAVVDALRADGHDVSFVNGGGTGSLDSTSRDPSVTELAAGSAFFKPASFDAFTSPHVRALEPACFFALEVTRAPAPGIVTCLGGGYVASGPPGAASLPAPWSPPDLRLLPLEGAGEVQTPVAVPPDVRLDVGDPIVFRHAKGGEVAERFREALLVEGGRVVGRAATYRGMGACFF